MKNLKKVLSLVLALAMALSLMTTAFAADAGDFNDYDEVSHNEAVDVMTAIGVFNGTGDGKNFDPTGTLTREQAAKIIVYMLLGQEDGDKLTAVVAPFSDVAADRWSAGAIAYCANAGILAGVGGGRFNPTGELTGLAFSKMLLVALGYNADAENLTGTAWAINAASLGVAAGLADELSAVTLSGPITREQAAQMAFNAEKGVMVDYASKIDVNTGNSVVTVSGGRYDIDNRNGKYEGQIDSDNKLNFAEKYCTKLVCDNDTDAFEIPADTWYFAGDKIGTYNDTAKLTYTTAVKYKDLKKDLPASVLTADYYIDGAYQGDVKSNLTSSNTTKIGGNGVLINVYYTYDSTKKGYDVTIIEINTYATKVNNCEKNSDDKYDIEVDAGDNYKFESKVSFNEDTVVLYTWSAKTGDVESMDVAESLTGDTSVVKTDRDGAGESFTLDGKVYEYSKQYDVNDSGDQGKLKTNASNLVAYLDSYGYVIRIDDADVDDNYAVVLNYGTAWAVTGSTVDAKLLLSDGTVVTAEIKTKDSAGTPIDFDETQPGSATNVIPNTIVKYSVNGSGVYTIVKNSIVSPTTADVAVKLDKGVSKFQLAGAPVYANNKTIFFLYDGSDYVAYTGINNVPSLEADGTTIKVTDRTVVQNGNVIEAVYLESNKNIETGTGSENAAFIFRTDKEKFYDVKDVDTYYTVKAVVDGEATTVDVSSGYYASLTVGGNLVSKLSIDKNNRVTNTSPVTIDDDVKGASSTTTFARAKNGVVKIGSSTYTYKDNAIVYVYDKSDDAFSRRSITALRSDKTTDPTGGNDDFVGVYAQLDEGVITGIYYVQN